MSDVLFEVSAKFSKKITLKRTAYHHISERHPEVSGVLDMIKQTLVNPQEIRRSSYEETVWLFYRQFDETPVGEKFLMVGVKLYNSPGIVITSYFTDKIKMGDQIWMEK